MPRNHIAIGDWERRAALRSWSRLSRAISLIAIAACSALAADKWFSATAGSVELIGNAAPKQALEVAGQVEQLRYALGELIGNPELAFLPPVRLLVLKSTSLPPEIRQGRSRLMLPLQAGAGLPAAAFEALAKQLLDHGAARLPAGFAEGLEIFLSTIEVKGAHIIWGAPPALQKRTLNWARVELLATDPAYTGKLRVILFNLQKGSAEDPAFRNATGKNAREFAAEAERFLKAGIFRTADAPSRTLNAQRDLKMAPLTEDDGKLALADLLDKQSEAQYQALISAKSHMSQAYEGLGQLALKRNDEAAALENFSRAVELESKDASLWVSYAKVETDRVKAGEAIEHALDLDPKSAEAHYLLGVRKNDPIQFEIATTFSPQNWTYWDALATAYLDANRYSDAIKAWRSAEQNAPDTVTRERMERNWRQIETRRIDFETAERKRTEDDERARIEKSKAKTAAELHLAEARINAANGSISGVAPVPWDEVMPVELKGTLTQVECLGSRTRISVTASDGGLTKLLVKNRKGLVCGSAPKRPVSLEYLKRPDEKLGTVGEIEKVP